MQNAAFGTSNYVKYSVRSFKLCKIQYLKCQITYYFVGINYLKWRTVQKWFIWSILTRNKVTFYMLFLKYGN